MAEGAQAALLIDENGNFVGIVLDGSVYRLEMAGKLRNAGGTFVNPSTEDTLATRASEGTLTSVDAYLALIDTTLDAIKDTDGIADLKKWLGSSAPTVGQKVMASSIPVSVSSD